mgnify:CR=1|jgi:hypothetical protein
MKPEDGHVNSTSPQQKSGITLACNFPKVDAPFYLGNADQFKNVCEL